jgi:hypothetical protein
MKLPSRMLDLSVPLDNETVLDPPVMRPKIEYKTNKENAWMLLRAFQACVQKICRMAKVGRSNSYSSAPTTARTWTPRIISNRKPSGASE